MLPACSQGLISVLNEQAARSTGLTEKLASLLLSHQTHTQVEKAMNGRIIAAVSRPGEARIVIKAPAPENAVRA